MSVNVHCTLLSILLVTTGMFPVESYSKGHSYLRELMIDYPRSKEVDHLYETGKICVHVNYW